MDIFKTYNLKLDKKTHFKLKKIELEIEEKSNNKKTRNEIICKIIQDYKI